jgi:hypothetical protein
MRGLFAQKPYFLRARVFLLSMQVTCRSRIKFATIWRIIHHSLMSVQAATCRKQLLHGAIIPQYRYNIPLYLYTGYTVPNVPYAGEP